MAAIKSGFLTVLLSVAATFLTWAWLAGGALARTETRLEDHERRLVKVEQIQSDLAEIKAMIQSMQAEQRILHGKPGLGR